jgi:membrane-bound lytic murein transglycosylase MltF
MHCAGHTLLATLAVSVLALGLPGCGQQKPPAHSPAPPAAATAAQGAPATAAAAAPPVELSVETAAPSVTDAAQPAGARQLSLAIKPWAGDFQAMLERKVIRFLVPYGRTLYFNDKGAERGITVDTVRDFERYINQKYRKDKRPITVVIFPTTRDKLYAGLVAGTGDIAAGNLTVTEARLKTVDFVAPDGWRPVRELIVTGPNAPEIKTIEDLSGKTVAVRPSTSYYESIQALNARFAAQKKPPMRIQQLPDQLEDEDKLEMLNAGVLDIVVVDDWKADMWAQVLPHIKVHDDLVVRDEGKTGWAIRKGSPELAAAILDFYKGYLAKQGVAAYRFAQYFKRIKQIQDPTGGGDYQRFERTLAVFREYGNKYDFDPLMLAAQGYQESRLDQQAKSHVGAIGVMQLMPATGRELDVGDIHQVEPNIHAGAKYLDQLMTRYFKDAKFDEQNRTLFAFAAYNAGPGRIQQMRAEARKRGLDPDKWFNNVEIVTAEKVGMETTTYVRNIYKYYVSYRLTLEAEAAKRKAIDKVAPGRT